MILAAQVHWAVTVPLAAVLLASIGWYWRSLGRSSVSRRRIRRSSLIVMALLILLMVRALSFVDPAVEGRLYAVLWTAVLIGVLVLVALAIVDALNSFRIHQEQHQEAVAEAAVMVYRALQDEQRKRSEEKQSPPEIGGEANEGQRP